MKHIKRGGGFGNFGLVSVMISLIVIHILGQIGSISSRRKFLKNVRRDSTRFASLNRLELVEGHKSGVWRHFLLLVLLHQLLVFEGYHPLDLNSHYLMHQFIVNDIINLRHTYSGQSSVAPVVFGPWLLQF